jgi:colanic acid/amylovoran biosynthesis glycosyltransferase
LFNQVDKMPANVERHVVCQTKANLDQFSVPNIHCLRDHPARYYWELGMRKLRLRRHLPFLVDAVRRHGVRIVHSHWGDAAWRDMPSVRRTAARHVVTFYGKDVNFLPVQDRAWRARYLELFAHVDAVMCEGPHMARCIVALGGPAERVHVHHLGADVDRIKFQPRRWLPGKPLRVLIAASFREKKGIPLGLTALARLRREIGSMEITIIGDASADPRSQPEKQRILATIRKHKLEHCVKLLGYQPHAVLLEQAYAHHVFLSPSLTAPDGDTEGGAPVALMDMASTGMAIVSSTHCDIPEVIVDGETGFLAREGDLPSLEHQLHRLVEKPERWEDMVRAGRSRMEREFNARIQAKRLAAFYGQLIAG